MPPRLCVLPLLLLPPGRGAVAVHSPPVVTPAWALARLSARALPPAARISSAVTSGSESMPSRWKNVHECERPLRWREEMDEEACQTYVNATSSDLSPEDAATSAEDIKAYSTVVPPLLSIEEFLQANARAVASGKLVVVKFYSKQCPACLRIAAKFRRLAMNHKDSLDCYEAELRAARPLLKRLGVTAVPCVQVFDGEDITRLAHMSCQPKEFKKIEDKIRGAIRLARDRRGLLRRLGEPMLSSLKAELQA
ncbi:MAG: hypothetical protein SGPRY_003224 [Prymnesium sp.]